MRRLKLYVIHHTCNTILLLLVLMVYQSTPATLSPISTPVNPPYFGSHYIILSSSQLFGSPTLSGAKPFDNFPLPLGRVYTNVKEYNIIMSSFKCETTYNFGLNLSVAIVGNPTSKVNVTVWQLNSTIFSKIGVSVILIAEPFDKVMSILEYDLDVPNQWYPGQNIVIPASSQYYTFLKSMNIRSISSSVQFSWDFSTQNGLNTIDLKYTSNPNKSTAYDQKIQAVIIFVDITAQNANVQFTFLSFNRYCNINSTFPSATLGIDTAKYGTDFNIKCIFGMPSITSFNYNHPYLLFNLDPNIGVINGQQNSVYSTYFQAYCFRDLQCPVSHPFKKLGDNTNCYNCADGVSVSSLTIPNCVNSSSSYDSSVSKTSFSSTGAITGYCMKCIDCIDQYYAENGTCHLCNIRFYDCQICNQTSNCITCFNTSLIDTNHTCISCSIYISNCSQCNSVSNCLKCNDGYYLKSGICIQCSLTIQGCIKCNSPTNCFSCNAPLVPKNISGTVTCECQNGWRVTSTCSQIYGCISSHMINNKTICYACNSTGNFMYIQGHSCVCQAGYVFNNKTYTCDSVCDDGIWVQSEGCDDSNRNRDDGCDENCRVQPNFICENVILKQSICRLNIPLNTSVYSLSRKFGSSSLILKLQYNPPFHNFITYNSWTNNVIVNSSKISFISYEFDGNILVLHYSILQSIQYQYLNWTLLYDSNKFITTNQSLSILMRGQNAPLTYQPYYKHQIIIYIVSYVLGGVSLVIAIVAMAKAESNIAFELSTTVMFIFYSRLLTFSSNSALIYALGGLRAAAGWNQFMPDQHRDYLEFVAKNRFFLKSQLSLIIILTLSVIITLLIIKFILQCKFMYELIFDIKTTQKQQQHQQVQKSFLRHFYINYDRFEKKFVTPIILISMFTILSVFHARETICLKYSISLPLIVINLIRAFYFIIVFYYAGMIGVIVGVYWDSLQVQQSKKRKNNTQLQFKTYINVYSDMVYIYLICLVMMIVFSLDYKMETPEFGFLVQICFAIIVLYLVVIILMRPYNDKLSQFAIISHQVIKLLFLVFIYLLKLSLLTYLIQLILVYFFLVLILMIQIVSVIRIKKSWIPFKTQQQEKKQQKLKKNGEVVASQQQQQKKKKLNYQKGDKQNPYRYENIFKRERQQQLNNLGYVKDEKRKNENVANQQFNALQNALEKGNLNNFLLGKDVTHSGDVQSLKKKQDTNFIDDEIVRRQKMEQLRKIKQKLRKQQYPNVELPSNKPISSVDKTWRPLTHQEQLEKKYEYDVWREKNLERAMWQEQEMLKAKGQNKKNYGRKNA